MYSRIYRYLKFLLPMIFLLLLSGISTEGAEEKDIGLYELSAPGILSALSILSPTQDTILCDNNTAAYLDTNSNAWTGVRFTPLLSFRLQSIYFAILNDTPDSTNGCSLYVVADDGLGQPDWPSSVLDGFWVAPPLPNMIWMQVDLSSPLRFSAYQDFHVIYGPAPGGPYPGPGWWDLFDSDGTTTQRSYVSHDNRQTWITITNSDAFIRAGGLYGLTKEEALHILGSEVLQPSSGTDTISATMVPAPLVSGIVEPGFGGPPTIDIASISGNPQWFAMVDSFPCALFEHAVIYVFIDDVTGEVTTFSATDWPYINGVPMGEDTLQGERLIWVYPLVPRPDPISPGVPTTEPFGDYGDAPDGQLAYEGVMGAFPTFFATTNSVLGRPGAHALTTGLEMLGAAVSVEQDVVDPADPDLVTNIRDADSDERMFVTLDPNTTPATSHLIYDVTVAPGAPNVDRLVNVLFDFDTSGNWSGNAAGTEWTVVNKVVNVSPGATETQISPPFSWGDGVTIPTHVWVRVALTRSEIDPGIFGADGWDGSGAFALGEIEDFELYLRACPPGPPPGEPGDPLPPGPEFGSGPPITYYALVVQGVDHPGQKAAAEAADVMEGLLEAQGYTTERLNGDNVTAGDIEGWMNGVKADVICIDRILIYFIAHGKKNTPGGKIKLNGGYTGAQLAAVLDLIPPCEPPNDYCDTPETCCDVTVIMESCYSGQWMDPLKGEGRRIITTSSSTQPSYFGKDGSGGEYSDRYNECARDPAADANGDGDIEPHEAHNCAKGRLQRPQTPQMDDQTCECKDVPCDTLGCCELPYYCDMISRDSCITLGGTWYPSPPYQCIGDSCVPESTFTIECSPSVAYASPGDPPAVLYTVDVDSIAGYFLNVDLELASVDPPEPGITATFNPGNAPAPYTSDVTIEVDWVVAYGDYTLTFQGVGDDEQTKTCDVTLRVQAPYDEAEVAFFHGMQRITNYGALANDALADNFLWYGITALLYDGTIISAVPVEPYSEHMALDVYDCEHVGFIPDQHLYVDYDEEYNANIAYAHFYAEEDVISCEYDSLFVIGIMEERVDFSIKIKIYYNPTETDIPELWAGVYEDWDVGDYSNNWGDMDTLHNLMWMYDVTDPSIVFGIMKAPFYDEFMHNMTFIHNPTEAYPTGDSSFNCGNVPGLGYLGRLMMKQQYRYPGYWSPDPDDRSTLIVGPPFSLNPGEKHIEIWINFGRNLGDELTWSQWYHRVLRYAGFYRGDIEPIGGDGDMDLGDLIFLINYLYKGGPASVPYADQGDVNADRVTDLGDLLYLISYIYKGGPPPKDYVRFIPSMWSRPSLFTNPLWQ